MRRGILAIMALALIWILASQVCWNPKVRAQSLKNLEEDEKAEQDSAKLRSKFLLRQRAFPFGVIPADWRLRALEHVRRNVKVAPLAAEPLVAIGPAPIANGRTFVNRQGLEWNVIALPVVRRSPDVG